LLQLKNIVKHYYLDTMTVEALKGVDLQFTHNEFVCILGPSGCGKTTLLNIIGGLDQYTDGDLIINGRTTKDYKDADWDAYRNHSIGFVFQTYNLIPHQNVLANVELALTLSGVSKAERTARATEVLTSVGLADQIHKKPNQLSGGQMQRVAIARALVNNPDILLADEPTGSLDSETSVQIMELLKEISRDKLVIMVTHNPDLADKYSTRIVRLLDGLVTDDTSPPQVEIESQEKERLGSRQPSMSFFTALSLSLNNLMTKKTRAFLTAFAGSIGIIGIALIMSLSNGLQLYIHRVEEETLASYPIIIERETFDISTFFNPPDDMQFGPQIERTPDRIYVNNMMSRITNMMMAQVQTNDLVSFKAHIEANRDFLDPLVTYITYSFGVEPDLFFMDDAGVPFQVNPNQVFEAFGMGGPQDAGFNMPMMGGGMSFWIELLGNQDFLDSQYDVIAGRWPENKNEVVLIVSENNRITDLLLYSLGLRGAADLREMQQAIMGGQPLEIDRELSFSFDDILALNYRLLLPVDRFVRTEAGWTDASDDFLHLQNALNSSELISIVGILSPNEYAVAIAHSGVIGFTSELTKYIIEATNAHDIVLEQRANPDIDIFTGRPFDAVDYEPFSSLDDVLLYAETLPPEEQQEIFGMIAAMRDMGLPEPQIEAQVVEMLNQAVLEQMVFATLSGNLAMFGAADLSNPATISIYPSSFENKDLIVQFISDYNAAVDEDREIVFTDFVGLLMSSITTVINAVSYVLIAFVSISLVVSSIMIGIITYISVLERTKEIGILRSIGAAKRDISRVFNAETLILGFIAGAIGIGVTLLLTIPANAIIFSLTEIRNVAQLPLVGSVALVIISMILSLLAGLLPSRVAAKKDPVVALRTE
jgi:putative ABC transport system permease protein